MPHGSGAIDDAMIRAENDFRPDRRPDMGVIQSLARKRARGYEHDQGHKPPLAPGSAPRQQRLSSLQSSLARLQLCMIGVSGREQKSIMVPRRAARRPKQIVMALRKEKAESSCCASKARPLSDNGA